MDQVLASTIKHLATDLESGLFPSEATIKQGVVWRVLHDLDWPSFDVGVFAQDYEIGSGSVSGALCHPPNVPAILVEVTDPRHPDDARGERLYEYCNHHDVPIALLTDGRNWRFFFPSGEGGYDDGSFSQVDLLEADPRESAMTLSRYLARHSVKSGKAQAQAQRDCTAAFLQRRAQLKYVSVWRSLVSEPESLLLDLFCEEVESETGVQPDRHLAAEFIRAQATLDGGSSRAGRAKPTSDHKVEPASRPSRQPTEPSPKPTIFFRGETETFDSAAKLLVAIFSRFASMDPNFCSRYSKRYSGSRWPYVARLQAEFPDYASQSGNVRPLPGGWWISTHFATEAIVRRVKEACEVMGLTFDSDLTLELPAMLPRKGRS